MSPIPFCPQCESLLMNASDKCFRDFMEANLDRFRFVGSICYSLVFIS